MLTISATKTATVLIKTYCHVKIINILLIPDLKSSIILTSIPHEIPPVLTPQNKPQTPPISPL